jgi:signal transduction histidine kinase
MKGKDEFAQLGNALDEMAGRLEAQRGELIETRSGLERTVAARTEDLARANERLKRTDAMRQEFLANISHELRTPITVIRGEADVTLRCRDTSTADYRSALTRIVEQARRLGKLVDDLLLIARARADALRLDLQPVSLRDLLSDACGHAEAMADAGTEIRLISDDPHLAALGDADRLSQLFMILLDNAIRYSGDDGAVTVSVTGEGDSAAIAIEDNGIGMSAQDVESVFERFYRGEVARRMAPQGSGLGLHIAKAIVSAHDGDIRIESAPGEGTIVYVTLTRAVPRVTPAVRAQA